jgi:hypothetical protein
LVFFTGETLGEGQKEGKKVNGNRNLNLSSFALLPFFGRPISAARFWPPIFGLPNLAAHFWPPIFGRPILASQFWPPKFGRPFLAALFWPPIFGHPILAALFWPPIFGRPILAALFSLQFWPPFLGRPLPLSNQIPNPVFNGGYAFGGGLRPQWRDPTRILTPHYHWPVSDYYILFFK